MHKITLTSQGTVSLPAAVRRRYNLHPGDILTLDDTDGIRILKNMSIVDMRKINQAYAEKKLVYKQGDGMAAHIAEKYGEK